MSGAAKDDISSVLIDSSSTLINAAFLDFKNSIFKGLKGVYP